MAASPSAPEGLRCPLDHLIMDKERIEGAVVDKCPRCGGLWFDATELARVSGDTDLEGWASSTFAFAKLSPFPCPRCGGQCYQSHVGLVTLDTCKTCHGVWVDHDELSEAERQAVQDRRIGRTKPTLHELLRAK